jgi:hypothetical protein
VVGGAHISETNVYSDNSAGAALYVAAEAEWNTYGSSDVTVTGGTLSRSNRLARIDQGAIMVYSSQGPADPNTDISFVGLSITGTRASAARQVSVVQRPGSRQSRLTFADLSIRGGNRYLYGGHAPATVSRRLGWTWNGRPVADHLGWV